MAQVNIALDDRVVAALDRIAASKGMRRPELLKASINELIDAHDAGRLAFQSVAGPKLDASVSGLVHQLRDLVIELDRAQGDNARLFGKLIEKWNGGEEANRIAYNRLLEQVNDSNHKAYLPFFEATKRVIATMEAVPSALAPSLAPQLDQIRKQLVVNNELARQPRTQRNLVLGDDRMLSAKFLAACAGVLLGIGVLVGLILPNLTDGLALQQGSRLLNRPDLVCRMLERRYGSNDCTVPTSDRDLGLKVIAHEARQ